MIPRRVHGGARRQVVRASAESGAEAEDRARGEENGDFGSEAAGAEFLEAGGARDDEADEDEGDGEEGDDGEEGLAVEEDVAVDAVGVGVEGVEGLDDGGDDHGQGDDDEDVDGFEEGGEERVPAGVGVGGADDALGEDEVDDEEEDDAGGDQDLRGDGEADVGLVGGPGDAQDAAQDAGHAEAEEHAAHEEFVVALLVDLQDCHVGDCTEDEEDEEDGADGDIDADGWETTERGGSGWVGRMKRVIGGLEEVRFGLLKDEM